LQLTVANNLSRQLDEISPEKILEIGCGTGLLSKLLLQRYPTCQLLVTDISQNMLAVTRNQLKVPNVQFKQMDAENLLLENLKFDLIISNMVLHWFSDIINSINKITNVLTSSGKLLFSLMGENSFYEWKQICKTEGLKIGVQNFPAIQDLRQHLPNFKFQSQTILKTYSSIYEFFKTLKLLGVATPNSEYLPMKFIEFKKILKKYNEKFPVTYEIIYGECTL
jgi:malonyl-CoA O-methyltransferase